MQLKHTFYIALANLTVSKLRTILAMLGILVGTASVVAMVSSGQLATAQALAQFKTLGTDLLSVYLSQDNPEPANKQIFSLQDAENIKTATPEILEIAPYTSLYAQMFFQGGALNASIVGATDALANVIQINLLKGRFISFLDNYSYYCVLGNSVYESIKNQVIGDIIGKQILIGNTYYTVVGVAKPWPQNSFFNQDVNYSVMIPIKTSGLISQYAQINSMVMKLAQGADIDAVENKITAYMNHINPSLRLFFRSAKQLVESMEKQKQIFTLFLGLIGSISLIVGGIGVMNIMLVSVAERRREIGIRRAIGAKRRDIQLMFLVEAIILALLGGTIGVILGLSTSFIIAEYAHWHFTIFVLPPLIGFTVSVLVGVFFGFYPAYQASRLDPIETLHSE